MPAELIRLHLIGESYGRVPGFIPECKEFIHKCKTLETKSAITYLTATQGSQLTGRAVRCPGAYRCRIR